MSDRKKYQSGAAKRKLKKELEKKRGKLPKLDTFFSTKSQSEPNLQPSTSKCIDIVANNSVSQDEDHTEELIGISQFQVPKTTDISTDELNFVCANTENLDENEISPDAVISTKDTILELESDLGHFVNKPLTDDQKRLIIDKHSLSLVKHMGPFPKDPGQQYRRFSAKLYYSQTSYGPVPRFWLHYSKILDAAYCEPCWLFSLQDNQWRTGVRDWKGISNRIKVHSSSKHHVQACAVYDAWKKNKTINEATENEIREQASFWRMVLQRLFDITLMLAKSSLAFRGHREELEKNYFSGNFLTAVHLLAKYDDVMKKVINIPKGTVFFRIIISLYISFYFRCYKIS